MYMVQDIVKHNFKKHIELMEEYAARLQEYSKKLRILGSRNSYSKTDHDATFMRMKEDAMTLLPFLRGMETSLHHKYPVVVADAGYESEENYSFLENHGIVAMIKPANYEISKRKKYQTDISRKENMMYNPDGNFYICKRGCRLYACGTQNRKTGTGYIRKEIVYRCYECNQCPHKSECIKGRNWKIFIDTYKKGSSDSICTKFK